MLHESHYTITNSSLSKNDYGDDHLSSTTADTKIYFISNTSNSMTTYNDDDDAVQSKWLWLWHSCINYWWWSYYWLWIQCYNSVKPNLGYGIAERLNALKRLKTSVYGSNILEQYC